MLRWLRDRIAVYKLNRKEKSLDEEAVRVQKAAKEKKQPELYDEWESAAHWEYEVIAWSRKKVVSDALIREADELHLPRPQYGDNGKWEEEEKDEPLAQTGMVLTPEAMAELRGTIRKERRERRETVESWVKIIGGLLTIVTGLVGALIGLVSVLKHK